MKTPRHAATLVGLCIALATPLVHAQTSNTAMQAAPDNSKSNKSDAINRTVTADDQKNDASDVMLTKQIRASVMADKSLSTYAHNVKIITVNGNVTLNGVVRSQPEKDSVAAKAQSVVQNGSVTNNLKIAPAK